MASKKTKSIAFQVIMSIIIYSIALYLLYSPYNAYKEIYARSSSLPKVSLLYFAGCELLVLFIIYLTRSNIFLSILYHNFWMIGKKLLSESYSSFFLKTPQDLASFLGTSVFGSSAIKIESLLTITGRMDILEEIRQGIARKGYDINKIFIYNDTTKTGCTYASGNNFADCILVSNAFITLFDNKPKTISALLLHEISYLENRDFIVSRILSFILNSGAIILPLVWVIRRWRLRKTVEGFLYAFILSKLWGLVLSIPINLYHNYCILRADRGLIGTGYEKHMIFFLAKLFFIAPPELFGLNYDTSVVNWIYFTHPSNLHRIEQIKQNM
ncbi:heat shock protein HtpX [Enteropsectra breve]|nr:heat shock protein HtpX [Enteropsectra breve]